MQQPGDRSDRPRPRPRTTTWEDSRERRWKDSQRQHRDPKLSADSSGGDSKSKTRNTAQFLRDVHSATNTGGSVNRSGKPECISSQDTFGGIDDLLQAADYYHIIAEKYDGFDANLGVTENDDLSLDRELSRLWRFFSEEH
jgi:hypothetical protein